MNFKERFRNWSGAYYILDGLTRCHNLLEQQRELIRQLISEDRSRPVLACVTVICEGVDCGAPGEGGKVFTTLGAEAFVRPGGRVMIPIEPQRMTGQYTFFVSGHPNLVIRQFNIGNDFKMSNSGSAKFGRVHGVCEIGQRINVEVEYRESP